MIIAQFHKVLFSMQYLSHYYVQAFVFNVYLQYTYIPCIEVAILEYSNLCDIELSVAIFAM